MPDCEKREGGREGGRRGGRGECLTVFVYVKARQGRKVKPETTQNNKDPTTSTRFPFIPPHLPIKIFVNGVNSFAVPRALSLKKAPDGYA